MTRGMKSALSIASLALAATVVGTRPALAEIPLVEFEGWHLSTDGRVNTYLSVAEGKALPEGQSEIAGAGISDTATSKRWAALQPDPQRVHDEHPRLHRAEGGEPELQGHDARRPVDEHRHHPHPELRRAGGSPRALRQDRGELGEFLAGSHLALFGRGGILVDTDIAHNYGLGYPCAVKDVSGGGCGMTAFGAPFPGFEPGFYYATPSLAGVQLSLGSTIRPPSATPS